MSLLFLGKPYECSRCGRRYQERDSMERHQREKHGPAFEREEAKLRRDRSREKRKTQRRAEKHRKLHFAVVHEAMQLYRFTSFQMLSGTSKPFLKACAALEKFQSEPPLAALALLKEFDAGSKKK